MHNCTLHFVSTIAVGTALLCTTTATATPIFVSSGASIGDAVSRAMPGDEIVLQAGGIYTEMLTLPDKGNGPPITIRSSATLPERRIGPADRALLPSLGSGTGMAVITISGSRWRLVGLAFRANTGGHGDIIEVGGSAADIVIDRVLIEGGAQGQKRAVAMNGGGAITVTRSYVSNIWKAEQESQALAAWNGPGPFTITDNYLEAASVNILFGGADSSSEARMPADILVESNHLTKRLAWKDASGYAVKNLFELKAARRVVVRNNVMENNWEDGQSGWAVVFTPRNQNGGATWTAIEDVLFEGNIVRGTIGGVNITGRDNLGLTRQTRRVTLRHNVFITDNEWLQAMAEIGELTLDHNTVMNGGTLLKLAAGRVHEGTYKRSGAYAVGSLTILNSLMLHGPEGYGIWGEASGIGTVAMSRHTNTYDMRRNVVAGENGWGMPYPVDTQQPGYEGHAAQFITPDFRLVDGSGYRGAALDGTDLGAATGVLRARLPFPWTAQDVGRVGIAGGATLASGTFALQASGADVWGTTDGLHYVFQRAHGDIEVIARIASVEGAHVWTKAGVMIRESLTADSPHAFMMATAGKGFAYQRRLDAGGLSTHTSGGPAIAPAWVKLQRRGSTVTAFWSADGITWALVGSDTFTMPDDIYVGLALTSHDDRKLAGATFDNVTVR